MKFISPDRWRVALLVYAIGGLALGFCNRPLNLLALHQNIRPGIGTFVNINLIMPVFMLFAAANYPRIWTVWAGALISTVAFYVAMHFVQIPDVTQWSARSTLFGVHPVLVLAFIGYGIVGTIAALGVRRWRIVGLVDAALRCKSCGYLLVGLTRGICPECGAPFDPRDVK